MRKSSSIEAVCLVMLGAATAHAQDTGAPAPSPPAPVATPAPSAPSPAPACVPDCRAGFVCVGGSCVSACNPPCPAGESCTADRQCVAPQAPAASSAAPSSAPAPAPEAAAAPAPRWQKSHTVTARRDEMYESVSANERIRTGAYYHDGFYLRFGVGVGWMYGQISADSLPGDITTTGLTVPLEFALGGTPVAGIVLGVGSYGLLAPALNYEIDLGTTTVDRGADLSSFTMLGPFVDFYIRPAFGMHLQASPTLVLVSPGQSDDIGVDLSGIGYGAMLGAGYEIWVSKQWGGGWLLRLQAAKVKLEDDDGNEYDYVTLMPSVLFTVTLH